VLISNLGTVPSDRAFSGSLLLIKLDILDWVAIGGAAFYQTGWGISIRMFKSRFLLGGVGI
jgi:hypothetical protein